MKKGRGLSDHKQVSRFPFALFSFFSLHVIFLFVPSSPRKHPVSHDAASA